MSTRFNWYRDVPPQEWGTNQGARHIGTMGSSHRVLMSTDDGVTWSPLDRPPVDWIQLSLRGIDTIRPGDIVRLLDSEEYVWAWGYSWMLADAADGEVYRALPCARNPWASRSLPGEMMSDTEFYVLRDSPGGFTPSAVTRHVFATNRVVNRIPEGWEEVDHDDVLSPWDIIFAPAEQLAFFALPPWGMTPTVWSPRNGRRAFRHPLLRCVPSCAMTDWTQALVWPDIGALRPLLTSETWSSAALDARLRYNEDDLRRAGFYCDPRVVRPIPPRPRINFKSANADPLPLP